MCKYTNTQTDTWHESTYGVVYPLSSHLSKGLLHIKAYTYSIEKYTDMSSWIGTPTGSHMHITIYTYSLSITTLCTYKHRYSHTKPLTCTHTHIPKCTHICAWITYIVGWSHKCSVTLTETSRSPKFTLQDPSHCCWNSENFSILQAVIGSPRTNSCFSVSPSPPTCSQRWQFARLSLSSDNHANTLQWHFT